MDNNPNVPYANLDPNVILDAIESAGFRSNGSLLALNSYENRVYQVGIEDADPLIAKFYRPHRWTNAAILEEHHFAHELANHEIPVVAPMANEKNETLHFMNDFRFALFPRRGGRALELDNLEQLEWMGRFIGRLHAISASKPFSHRITLNTQTYGHDAYQFLLKNNFIPFHLESNFCQTVDTVLQTIESCFAQAGTISQIRLHGDCHAGNVLWRDDGPCIVDLDDCLMGPAIQDIWMLLSGDAHQMKFQLTKILRGYREFHDFNPREIYLIEALRSLRLLHYSAWLAKRWDDPAFPINFPWFNTDHYWQQQIQNLREQVNLMNLINE